MAKKGSFNLDQEKIESHYFLLNLQIFHNGSPDFPLSGVGRSTVKKKKKKNGQTEILAQFLFSTFSLIQASLCRHSHPLRLQKCFYLESRWL